MKNLVSVYTKAKYKNHLKETNENELKSLLLGAGVLFVSPISLSYNSDVAHAEDKLDHSQAKVIYLSNQNLFDELEKKGYKLEDIFTKEEIKKYKAEDQLRAGKTQYAETGKDTATLYLSSAYTKQ